MKLRGITSSEICIILHIKGKLNSIIKFNNNYNNCII